MSSTSSRARCLLSLGILMATGCSAILGLEERPIDDGITSGDAASDNAVADGNSDASFVIDGSSDTSTEDAKDERIPCLGGLERAYFCDDFEAPTLSTKWTVALSGTGAEASRHVPPPTDAGGLKALSGAAVLASGFTPIPASGEAVIRFAHPSAGGGPLGVRFAFYLLEDAWPYTGERIPIAALKTAGVDQITLVFVPIQNGDGNIELDVSGQSTIQLGPTSKDTWICYQIVSTGTQVEAYVGNVRKDFRPFTQNITNAELGMRWNFGPGGENHFVYYDDAVIAPGVVPCF